MARTQHDGSRASSMGITPRFALSMTVLLAVVMGGAGVVLYKSSLALARSLQEETLKGTVLLTEERPKWKRHGQTVRRNPQTGVESWEVRYGPREDKVGWIYQVRRSVEEEVPSERLYVPNTVDRGGEGFLGLIFAMTLLVILLGAGVAAWVARKVSGPIVDIIDDIRQISRGDIRSLGHVRGPREIELLGRAIDRMTSDLENAQEAELELSVREREMELAGGVREALLPVTTPLIEGYDVGSSHLSSSRFGGDFHDYVELEDGRVGLLVCDVAGQGVPAALVGATARSYLRAQLLQGGDVAEALARVNRELARDVRRGMFVTALYVLVDPRAGTASIACAGHKIPLIRYTAADQKLRLVHPEGIALGFDEGPVFERALDVQDLALAPGDRLVLCNSGPVKVVNEAGEELGEKPFYGQVMRHAGLPTPKFLKGLRRGIETYAGEAGFPVDISLVTIRRREESA